MCALHDGDEAQRPQAACRHIKQGEDLAVDFPDTRVELFETVLGGGEELLAEGREDLAVCSQVPPGFVGDPLTHVRFIAVAAPNYPLHRLGRALTMDDLHEHRHLFVWDSGTRREREGAWQVTERRWTGHAADRDAPAGQCDGRRRGPTPLLTYAHRLRNATAAGLTASGSDALRKC